MKITTLEKKKRLYLMEIEETDKLYITEDTIVKFMLTKGKSLTSEELADIKIFAQLSYGKDLALYHLSFKQRTCKEVIDYLHKHEIDEAIIPKIISQLQADKWLDDKRYAQQFIQSNQTTGDKGPFVLKQKLLQKGIPATTIESALEDEDFSQLVEKVASKLYRKYANKLTERALRDKLLQSLLTKGFSSQLAKAGIDALEFDDDEDQELALLEKELDKLYRKYSKKYEGYDLKQRLYQGLYRKGFSSDMINQSLRDYL
ncbi:recombination regulator RecX [Streptococcus caprae]|uniref:Regulatory protein RecX n=1 Tax=Streptococcus caprae TaxID=1640501 RepID=A0ABV8CSS3_9STRE